MQRRLGDAIARLSDARLAWLLSAVLFALAAWPLALVDVPPLQDLPNHLATATVIDHPARYPELVFNGYLKTNSALFAWLTGVGRVVGLRAAARLFTLLVLAVGAVAYPRFALRFGGRGRMIVAAFVAWPLVHEWFVSMGMLDFALGAALAALLLVALEAQRRAPSLARGVGIAALAALVWYAHVFPLLVVLLLAALEVLRARGGRGMLAEARAIAPPLVPAAALATIAVVTQLGEPRSAPDGYLAQSILLPPWELLYNAWAEWFWAFTKLEIATLVPCVLLAVWAARRWRAPVPFFGPVALVVLAALYLFTPYVAADWFHVNSRFLPFLALAALARVPERLPRAAMGALAACALSYSVGLGVDYVRMDRDWARFTAGVDAVPEGARLLPLVFRQKGVSENTRSMLHAWGFYVVDRQTAAPLVFAHSRSFPLTYRETPPPQLGHMSLEWFAPTMARPDTACAAMRRMGVLVDDCGALWRERWAEFWALVEPRFTHVLLWAAPADVLAQVPPEYHVVFARDELTIVARPGP